jgi:membrane protein DedA with SNARE-associated domain
MEKFLESLVNLSPLVLYLLLFLSAYVENVCPPIPGDTVTVFGAYLVGIGRLDFLLVLLTTTVGSLLGFMTLYVIGYRYGREFFERKNYRFFPQEKIRQVESWFGRYGGLVIVGNRFLSGVRSVISIFSGIARLPWGRVCFFALISCTVWNTLLISAGYFLGINWKTVNHWMGRYNVYAGAALAIAAALWLLYRWRLRSGRKGRINS